MNKYFNFLFIFIYWIPQLLNEGIGKSTEYNYSDSIKVKITLVALLPYRISESSGLVFTDGNLWTHNDSGGYPWIFRIDTSTGKIIQTVVVDNFPNVDWEDITADSKHIYIGDFGNNYGIRKNLKILVIEKSDITDKPIVHVHAKSINFNYSDQVKFYRNNLNNFDCESILNIGDSLYLFSKDRGDNFTRVYRLSKTPGNYTISPITSFNVNGRICGASINTMNNELALIGYMTGTTHSFIWLMSNFNGTEFFSGIKRRIEIGNNLLHWKTEGIAFENKNRLFISCEKSFSQKAGLFIFEDEY